MPPASWHFADRPMPAPPPMIGWPRRTMAWKRSIRARRSKRIAFNFLVMRFGGIPGRRPGDVDDALIFRQPRDGGAVFVVQHQPQRIQVLLLAFPPAGTR